MCFLLILCTAEVEHGWLSVVLVFFVFLPEQVVKRALASQPDMPEAAERAEKFRQKYRHKLQTLRHQPLYERLVCLFVCLFCPRLLLVDYTSSLLLQRLRWFHSFVPSRERSAGAPEENDVVSETIFNMFGGFDGSARQRVSVVETKIKPVTAWRVQRMNRPCCCCCCVFFSPADVECFSSPAALMDPWRSEVCWTRGSTAWTSSTFPTPTLRSAPRPSVFLFFFSSLLLCILSLCHAAALVSSSLAATISFRLGNSFAEQSEHMSSKCSGFVQVGENLETSWNLLMVISRPGKVQKKKKSPTFWKSRVHLLYSYVHLRWVFLNE